MNESVMLLASAMTPFVAALGAKLGAADPKVRRHLASTEPQRCRGVVRVRSRGLAGRVLGVLLNVRSSKDEWIPFELQNEMAARRDVMIWRRILHFPGAPRRYEGHLVFDPRRRTIIDSMAWLDVELDPTVEDGAVVTTSGRQWVRLGRARLRLPGWMKSRTRECAGAGPDVHLSLAVHGPLVGEVLGYEAVFREVEK
jgi:hypothetical protein